MERRIKIYAILINIMFFCLVCVGQTKRYTRERAKGDEMFFKGNYAKALKFYEKHENNSNMFLEESFLHRLSETYYMLGRFDEAIACYNQSYQRGDKVFNVNFYKQLAQRSSTPSIYLAHIPNMKDSIILDDMNQYYIIPAHILNSKYNEFATIEHSNKIYFTSNRTIGKKKDVNTQKSHYDIYSISKNSAILPNGIDTLSNYKQLSSSDKDRIKLAQSFLEIKEFDGANSRFNDGPISFFNDSTVFITRNEKHRVSKNSVFNLSIYRGEVEAGEDVKRLRHSIFGRFFSPGSVGHISFTPSGKRAVMVANSEHTIGNSDLWFSDLQSNGQWGTPYSGGNDINTTGDEMFPFWKNDSLLYFASDGHKGFGGLDIFQGQLNENGRFTVANVGNSVNSEFDDFAFSISSDNIAMFTSDRSGGHGADDIYFAYPYEKEKDVGTVHIELISDAVAALGQEFYLMMKDSIRFEKFDIGESPTYAYENLDYGDYALLHKLTNDTIYDRVHLDSNDETIYVEFQVKPDSLPVRFNNFNFDTHEIAEIEKNRFMRLVAFLKNNPDLKIEVVGHTDQFGSDEYNSLLGMQRSEAMEGFLRNENVINEIITLSKGNTELVSKIDHRLNRRVDILLYENDQTSPLVFVPKGSRHCKNDLYIVYNHAEENVSPIDPGFYVKFYASYVHQDLSKVARLMKLPQDVNTFVYSTEKTIFRHYINKRFYNKEDAKVYAKSLGLSQFLIHYIN